NKIGPNVLEITATPVLIIPAFLPNLPGLDALDVIVIINGKTGPSLAPTNMRIIISKNKVDAKPDNAVVIDFKITAAILHALRFFVKSAKLLKTIAKNTYAIFVHIFICPIAALFKFKSSAITGNNTLIDVLSKKTKPHVMK